MMRQVLNSKFSQAGKERLRGCKEEETFGKSIELNYLRKYRVQLLLRDLCKLDGSTIDRNILKIIR